MNSGNANAREVPRSTGSGSAAAAFVLACAVPVSYTHLTLPTNREV